VSTSTPGVSFSIRTVWLAGVPWFVAADVCRALGLNMTSGTTMHLGVCDPDEVKRTRFGALGLPKTDLGSANVGQNTPVNLIAESGLYKLVMRSDKERARLFQNWVTRKVLPAIRQDGAYVLGRSMWSPGRSVRTN
jgi:prophage antirepressor-like protein